jgi:hypothetical protein
MQVTGLKLLLTMLALNGPCADPHSAAESTLTRMAHFRECGEMAAALAEADAAAQRFPGHASVHLEVARIYAKTGRILGQAQVRTMRDGRPGRFIGDWLLLESRGEPGEEKFLCVGLDSAFFHLYRARDGQTEDPAADLLLAELWLVIDRPANAAQVLRPRAELFIERREARYPELMQQVALREGELTEFLRHANMRADWSPEDRTQILIDAYKRAAADAAIRGDELRHVEWLCRAADLEPTSAAPHLAAANAAQAAERWELAVERYRKAVELLPAGAERTRAARALALAQANIQQSSKPRR